MKNTILMLLAFVTITTVTAQQSLNDYKYIVVPNTFEFLREADEYRLNSLTKFLFEKYNFEAVMANAILPSDLARNNCLGLTADVIKESSMFKTKLIVQLKDCKNTVVFTSMAGESRDKSYKVAYNEALRAAFKSFETVNYSYNPSKVIIASEAPEAVEDKQAEIIKLKEEIKVLKTNTEEAKPTAKDPETILVSPTAEVKTGNVVLYAQKTKTGYQLVDNTPKVIYHIKKTGLDNVFLVEGKNAILYQLDANWILEYYDNNTLQTKLVNIKF